jgi:chemotaxis protein methyltransferase CheR
LAHEERFDQALEVLEPACAGPDAAATHLVLKAHLMIERGATAAAAETAALALERDAWSADALLLLGRCARLRGDLNEAIRVLRRAVYHDPGCWRAHYQLAESYRSAGMPDLAAREYRILLQRLDDAPLDLPTNSALPCKLTASDLRFLCQRRLSHLADSAA